MARPNKATRERRKSEEAIERRRHEAALLEAMTPTRRLTVLQQEIVAVRTEDKERGTIFDSGIRPRTNVVHPLERRLAS